MLVDDLPDKTESIHRMKIDFVNGEIWFINRSGEEIKVLAHLVGTERDIDFIGFTIMDLEINQILELANPGEEYSVLPSGQIVEKESIKLIITLASKSGEECGRMFYYTGEKSVPKILTEMEQSSAIEKQVRIRTAELEKRIEELEQELKLEQEQYLD